MRLASYLSLLTTFRHLLALEGHALMLHPPLSATPRSFRGRPLTACFGGFCLAALWLLAPLSSQKPPAQESAAKKSPAKKEPAEKEPAEKEPAEKESAKKAPAQKKKKKGSKVRLPQVDLGQLALRELGPASMGGRVIGLAVDEQRPAKFYVATASGGLWKTVNNGTTFTPLFQNQAVMSIGAVAIEAKNSEHIWLGTGEANNRNSTSYGNGVYYSADGGKTWKHKGLAKTLHVGRIAIRPDDPKTVFVAAVGSLWGPNPERGLYRTRDGGETWKLVLKKDDRTGATEVRIDPENPDIVYCALYERQRDAFDGNHPAKRWGPGSGLYKSSDGGDSWKQMRKGLPTCDIGRVSMDIYRKDPRLVYALIETEKIGMRPEGAPEPKKGKRGTALMGIGNTGADEQGGAKLTQVSEGGPSYTAGLRSGDVVLELAGEGTTSYAEMLAVLREQRANDKQPVKVLRDGKLLSFEITFGDRSAQGGRGGGNSRTPFADRIGGQVANRSKSQGPQGFECGGLFLSKDRGESWERINSINPRPYYFSQVRVDPSDNQRIYICGIQFHWSFDGGKSFKSRSKQITMANVHVDYHALWVDPKNGKHLLLGCDGGVNLTYDRCRNWETLENLAIGQAYHAVADTQRPYWIYAGFQDNGSWGSPSATRRREGITNADVFKIGGGDGFVCRVDAEEPQVVFSESQGGNIGWRNLITGARGRVSKMRDRNWNWNTPFILSQFNSRTLYYGGSKLYRSSDRGRHAQAISASLVRKVPKGAKPSARPSLSSISESPRKPSILWVGTDDGKLWVTKDGGKVWSDVSDKLTAELPGKKAMWISSVHASAHADGRAYVCVDGHRSNDRASYVFVSEDFGQHWKSLAAGLPASAASLRCLRDDRKNGELLFLGAETGLFFSLDRGQTWQRMDKRFPAVAVHDFDVQQREQHLIVATHGRGVWAIDLRPLRALTAKNRKATQYLVEPGDVLRLVQRNQAKQGQRFFAIANPRAEARIYYHLGKDAKERVEIVIEDELGQLVFRAKGKKRAGLHHVDWNLRAARSGRGLGGMLRRRMRGARSVKAGTYLVRLSNGKKTQTQTFEIADDKAPLDISWPRPVGVGEGASVLEEERQTMEDEARSARSVIR